VTAGAVRRTDNRKPIIQMTDKMNNDQKFWLTVIALICGTVCCLILSIAGYYAYTNQKAFEQGYEQQTLPGEMGAKWVKREGASK
jgi:TRAP-type C4-dicarboxylate transport system permease small subunit